MESPLYLARKRAAMTQQEAADAWTREWPDDPKTAKALSYWETSSRQPSTAALHRLAQVYSCPVGDLLGSAVAYRVAVAVVRRGDDVLLVRRRDDALEWAFPTGQVKPGKDPARVAVAETAGETGVLCSADRELGTRLHPITQAWTHYVWCHYLAGEPANGDPEELTAATWAPIARLGEFIPMDRIYPPVLDALGGAARV